MPRLIADRRRRTRLRNLLRNLLVEYAAHYDAGAVHPADADHLKTRYELAYQKLALEMGLIPNSLAVKRQIHDLKEVIRKGRPTDRMTDEQLEASDV